MAAQQPEFVIRREPPREKESTIPPRPIHYSESEPAANQRINALRFAHKMGWLIYLWPLNPDTIPPSELEYLVVLRNSPAFDAIKAAIGERYGQTDLAIWYAANIRQPEGQVEKWRADEVLPMVRGIAIAHGLQDQILYHEGLK